MRLSKIKIAGFKSFVDPTIIDLRGNLTGIVGPNGCGKSNTIDAVRWVMGESSAKHLRGASMDDVIFNGSSARKPIGQASIELIFDNSDNSLGGEYAQFAEIGIKRQISRDGQSKYFLNNSRCRRRDITDIFLGTGLGPRSYAIIEQGMISRLIEAKPEELRNTLEEAAGISKYKDRRRETERRIKHTRENLDRLNDLREELDKQLAHLNRQAKAAEKFKTLKQQERRTHAELILMRLQKVKQDIEERQNKINTSANTHQAKLAEQRSLENQIEQARSKQHDSNDTLNTIQARFYEVGAEVSRLEQTIQHNKELQQRHQQDLQQITSEIESANLHAEEDRQKQQQCQQQLAELEPQLEIETAELEKSIAALNDAEFRLNEWQYNWQNLQQKLAEPAQQAQVERARMEQLEQQLHSTVARLSKLQSEQAVFNTQAQEEELDQQQKAQQEKSAQLKKLEHDFSLCKSKLQDQENALKQQQEQLQQSRTALQAENGILASLEVLQQASLSDDDTGRTKELKNKWLSKHNLNKNKKTAEMISIEPGWEIALERVLGDLLDSISVRSDDNLAAAFDDMPDISLQLLVDKEKPMPIPENSLASKVKQPKALHNILSGVYCVDSIQKALASQPQLAAGEILVTRDGSLIGSNWISTRALADNATEESVLVRQQQIDKTQASIKTLEGDLTQLEGSIEQSHKNKKLLENELSELQLQLNQLHRETSQIESAIQTTTNRIEQTKSNQQRVLEEIAELELQQQTTEESHKLATKQRNTALSLLESLESEKQQIEGHDVPFREATDKLRQQTQELRLASQQTQLKVETLKATQNNALLQLERYQSRLSQLQEREKSLVSQSASMDSAAIQSLTVELESKLEKRKSVEAELSAARAALQEIESSVRDLELKRHQVEKEVEDYRTTLESLKMEWQEVSVRQQTLQEQFSETDFDAETLLADIAQEISLHEQQKMLDDLQQKISRLGAINLAAIDEFKTQSERKLYLDAQNEDLLQALETLESAIAKIDKDTKTLFKETFEKVNVRIQEMFPQLFGGGKAHLEMTDDDLLSTGIAIMAQPPGKRISSIHLMSGGEKALTAVAMVFAIFELNPAPFCMLDEVDAPLDEANVGRFCQLVKKMSDRVQFIFITHNKTTMELAENLIGVTMREPGISRLVSVDVNEAARMANE